MTAANVHSLLFIQTSKRSLYKDTIDRRCANAHNGYTSTHVLDTCSNLLLMHAWADFKAF